MNMKRKAAALAVAALAAVAVSGVGAGAAQADGSSIPLGYVQLCAFGNYDVYANFGSFETRIVTPGNCWYGQVPTNGGIDIDVYEIVNNGLSTMIIGDEWYDSSVSGLGIGATGDADTTASIFAY